MHLYKQLNGYDPDEFMSYWHAELPEHSELLFAYYTDEDYSGYAFALFAHLPPDGEHQLYEVNGSHCSCYGLEGQWEPELVNVKELINRAVHGSMWHYNERLEPGHLHPLSAELIRVLNEWQRRFD